jgi:hypothetical protein
MDAIPWKEKIISSAPLIWLTSVDDQRDGEGHQYVMYNGYRALHAYQWLGRRTVPFQARSNRAHDVSRDSPKQSRAGRSDDRPARGSFWSAETRARCRAQLVTNGS